MSWFRLSKRDKALDEPLAQERVSQLGAMWSILLLLSFASLTNARATQANTHYCFGERATIVGSSGDDRIRGTAGDDVIVGLGGADEIRGLAGDDLICSGRGGSHGLNAFEEIRGGPGHDKIRGGSGSERIWGGDGDDVLYGGGGRNELYGGNGHDKLSGGPRDDYFKDHAGNDVMRGFGGDDIFLMLGGNDRVYGGDEGPTGDNIVYYFYGERETLGVRVDLLAGVSVGPGRDRIAGVENVFGTEQDDVLLGDSRSNLLEGAGGNDRLNGRKGDDCLDPGRGQNEVIGGAGFDFYTANFRNCAENPFVGTISPGVTAGVTVDLSSGHAAYDFDEEFGGARDESTLSSIEGIYGSSDEDTLRGDERTNIIFGGGAADNVSGRGGDDLLDGGLGADMIDGGDGLDDCRNGEVYFACESESLLLARSRLGFKHDRRS